MIETEQTVIINANINDVWAYARDIKRWAGLMPGLQDCDIIDENNSRWKLKVGAGGLVRTVKVLVRVEKWDGPGHAVFAYKLEGDPVDGDGAYVAKSNGPQETEITLKIRVTGRGPMAPMWEAMGKPLLPKFTKGFAEQLKAEIESANAGTVHPKTRSSFFARIWSALQNIWHRIVVA